MIGLSSEPSLAGLTTREAAELLLRHGPNEPVPRERHSRLADLAHTFADPMALMLAATAGIYAVVGDWQDAIIAGIALVPVLGVDVVLERRARQALDALAAAAAPRARVVRNGEIQELSASDVVPGDCLMLAEGDVICADGIVRREANLSTDESALTGESLPQEKQSPADGAEIRDASRVFAGSRVLAGAAHVTVTTTGTKTRFGAIARLVREPADPSTPLQKRVRAFVRPLIYAAVAVAAAVFGLGLARGETVAVALISGISLAMAAMPEEFPLVQTIYLALGAWRLAKHGVLVRRLAAVETLGSTTVLCVDKTGTLTAGRFTLDDHKALGASDDALLEAAVLACEDTPVDPLEQAIVAHSREHGIDPAALHRKYSMAWDYDFDPHGKHMSHVRKDAAGASRIDAKGSLEGILEHVNADPAVREAAHALENSFAAQGTRVLAVAGRTGTFNGDRASDERGLSLLGLLAFRDPIRADVRDAVARCREAGISIKILTGDHALTASSIATAAGLADPVTIGGAELELLDARGQSDAVERATVIARLRPEQKHAIVRALRASGEVVAMTGDGVNDAPALAEADVGVSMGTRATEVARAASDLVLLDDRFSAIVDAVFEGRRVFSNLRKAFLFLIGFHVPIIALAVIVPLAGLPLLLLPVHLVWLELVVHPVSALVFEGDDAFEERRKPPRPSSAPLIERGDLIRSVLVGVAISLAVLGVWIVRAPLGEEEARAMAMTVMVSGAILLVLAERRRGRGLRAWIVLGLVALSVPLATFAGPFAHALRLAPLTANEWAASLGLALASVGWRFLLPAPNPAVR